jgi:hypothetical protein
MHKLVAFSVELALVPLAKQNAAICKPVKTIFPLLFVFKIRSDVDSYAVTPIISPKSVHLIIFKLPSVFSCFVF